jgi:hypothetical protein
MGPFTILILVCAMAVERAACQPDTAIDVVQGPKVENQFMCGFLGQTTLAATAVAPRPGEEYLKVMCKRSASLYGEYTNRTVALRGTAAIERKD